jgi:AmiR/NasT family two-component response regulator
MDVSQAILRAQPIHALLVSRHLGVDGHQKLKAGGCVLHALAEGASWPSRWGDFTPDACVFHLDDLEAFGGVSALQRIVAVMPLVLLARDITPAHQDMGQRIGAMALLPADVDGKALSASLRLWVARDKELKALREAESKLRDALSDTRSVCHAVGVLAERHQLPVKEAFQMLRGHARGARKRMTELAREILPQGALH